MFRFTSVRMAIMPYLPFNVDKTVEIMETVEAMLYVLKMERSVHLC